MKKLLSLSALLALLFAANVHGAASSSNEDGMKFGLLLKPHFSGVDVPILPSTWDSMVFAPSVEIFDEIRLSSVVGLRVSLGYAYRGGKLSMGKKKLSEKSIEEWSIPVTKASVLENVPKVESVLRTHELELAVVPRFYLGGDEAFSLFVGPVLNYVSAAKLKLKVPSDDGDGEKEFDLLDKEFDLLDKEKEKEERIPKFNWGIVMGLDYEFDNGVTLGCAYNVKLNNHAPKILSPISAKTFSGGVTLGYNFAKLLK